MLSISHIIVKTFEFTLFYSVAWDHFPEALPNFGQALAVGQMISHSPLEYFGGVSDFLHVPLFVLLSDATLQTYASILLRYKSH